jgi:hypothetical protein
MPRSSPRYILIQKAPAPVPFHPWLSSQPREAFLASSQLHSVSHLPLAWIRRLARVGVNVRTSRQEQGRGGQLPLAGFTGFGRLIDGWYLMTRHVYRASHAPGGLVNVNLLIALLCTTQSSHVCNATHIYRLMKPCWQSLHTTKPHPVERSPMSKPSRPKGHHDTTNFPKRKVRRGRVGRVT